MVLTVGAVSHGAVSVEAAGCEPSVVRALASL